MKEPAEGSIEARTFAIGGLPSELVRDLASVLRSEGALGPSVRGRIALVSKEKLLFATSLVASAGLALVAAIEFGRPCAPRSPPDFLVFFVALAVPAALLATRALERRIAAARCPLPSGVFVLSKDVAVVEGDQLFVVPLTAIAGTTGPTRVPGSRDPEISLWLEGVPALAFRVAEKGATEAAARLELAMESARAGTALKDSLAELRRSSAWDRAPRVGLRAGYARSTLLSLPMALLFGLAMLFVRNEISDALAFAAAAGDTTQLRCYAEAHGARSAEVRAVLLPAAAYADAMQTNTPDAFASFLASYPGAANEQEARTHLYERAYGDAQASSWSLAPVAAGNLGR